MMDLRGKEARVQFVVNNASFGVIHSALKQAVDLTHQ